MNLERSFYKVYCGCCQETTPHCDNTTTLQCCVCLASSSLTTAIPSFYNGWDLAEFWQNKYLQLRSTIGIPAGPGIVFPQNAVASMDEHFGPVVPSIKVAYVNQQVFHPASSEPYKQ